MRAAWRLLLLVTACAGAPPPPPAAVPLQPEVPSGPKPDRPTILSGSSRRIEATWGDELTLEPCKFVRGVGPGIRRTSAECYPFDGLSAVGRGSGETLVGLFSQQKSILVTIPVAGDPRVETLPLWGPLWLSSHAQALDVVSGSQWMRRSQGAWTSPAPSIESGTTLFDAVWQDGRPTFWARTGGTMGRNVATLTLDKGAWTQVPFWPSDARPAAPPAYLHVDGKPGALVLSYVASYDGAQGLVVEPDHGAPVRAVPRLPAGTYRWSVAVRSKERLPLVALMAKDDLIVAAPTPSGAYLFGTIPGDGAADLARLPPRRSDREPTMQGGFALCSEAVDRMSSTRLYAPVPLETPRGDLLVFVRHRVERRHRWTLVPTSAQSSCDWVAERSVEESELVVARLSYGDGVRAEELVTVPMKLTVRDSPHEPRLDAALVGDTLDVVVGAAMRVEHLALDLSVLDAAH